MPSGHVFNEEYPNLPEWLVVGQFELTHYLLFVTMADKGYSFESSVTGKRDFTPATN